MPELLRGAVPASAGLEALFRLPFMVHALEASVAVALTAALSGWFMVTRRETFAGHTLSLMGFPGAGLAMLVGISPSLGLFGGCAAAGIVIGFLPGARGGHRSEGPALIGSLQAFGVAAGFVFLSLYHGVVTGYESLLFGDLLGVTGGQVLGLCAVAGASALYFAVVGRPLLFASVDATAASGAGVPVRLLGVSFVLVLALSVAAVAQITGVLLVFSLLVAPAATAQAISIRPGRSLALACALGVLMGWAGLLWAFLADLPVGFCVSTVAFFGYAAARVGRGR